MKPPLASLAFVALALTAAASRAAEAQGSPPEEWLTKAERTDFRQTGDYEETRDYARRLAEASPWIELLSFGRSPQGRDLMLLVASRDGAFDPAAARAVGKPVVLIQNGIHPGEIEGKDASLMLLRDMAVTREREALLEGVTVLVMPLFNVDGYGGRFGPHTRINQNGPAESGWRTTAENLNLNRDYMKADAPEMRAWLAVYDAWKPELLIDDHTTDGADFQYVMTYDMSARNDAPPSLAAWARDVFLPHLAGRLEKAGYPNGPYLDLKDPIDPAKGFINPSTPPRFSSAYPPLRSRLSLLVETHMLKPFEPRVRSTYELLAAALEIVGREAAGLEQAVRQAEDAASALGTTAGGDSVPMAFELSDSTADTLHYLGLEYRHELSEVSGTVRVIYGKRPREIDVPFYDRLVPGKKVRPPLGYLIPAQWGEIADRLSAHGVPIERLDRPVAGTFEVVRFSNVTWPPGPFEGRFLPSYETERSMEKDSLPAGSWWVPLANPYARLAMQLLEPEGPDSFVAWGFFNAIFEDKEYAEDYVMEVEAREMMEKDPKLAEEFEARVASDSAFRADPAARLLFFYEKTPYWDAWKNRYPVLRVVTPLDR